MTERDDLETELKDYVQYLPADRRPSRDSAARRQRLLPLLRAHSAREHRRVQRRRALARAAGLMALGGAGAATALWIASPGRMPVPAAARGDGIHSLAALTVIDGALLLSGGAGARTRTLHAGDSVALAELGAFESPNDQAVRVRVSDVVTMTLASASRARPVAPATGFAPVAQGVNATSPLQVVALALERGRAHFEVQKLPGDRRFHVVTADADVEVRGTVFDVALSPNPHTPTCVSVDEGLVQVAKGVRTRLLARGDSWDCSTPEATAEATSEATSEAQSTSPAPRPALTTAAEGAEAPARAGPSRVANHAAKADVGHARHTARGDGAAAIANTPTGIAASDLRAQNQIFQAALSAERGGRLDDAARIYRRLLARAPDGPLSAQARANLAAVVGARR